jgi:hypothetical protein
MPSLTRLIPALALAFLFGLSPLRASSKSGLGEMYPNVDCINLLGVNWYYTWGVAPKLGTTKAQFIPTIWSYIFAKKETFAALKNYPSGILLGFNEPEQKHQAAMSVEQALEIWPQMEGTGLRLGSPAVSLSRRGKEWLCRFMSEADNRGLRVDFICVHWYGNITNPEDVAQLKVALDAVHQEYGRPIWLTEFGALDQYFKRGDNRAAITVRFMREAVPMLEELPYLERYAWFTSLPSEGLRASALFRKAPTVLSPAGVAYQSLIKPLFNAGLAGKHGALQR